MQAKNKTRLRARGVVLIRFARRPVLFSLTVAVVRWCWSRRRHSSSIHPAAPVHARAVMLSCTGRRYGYGSAYGSGRGQVGQGRRSAPHLSSLKTLSHVAEAGMCAQPDPHPQPHSSIPPHANAFTGNCTHVVSSAPSPRLTLPLPLPLRTHGDRRHCQT